MTNAAIERLSGDLAQARSTIGDALRFVAQISDAESASEAYDRVKLVKEWARIKKLHNEVHRDMLRLEIHCLRKISQLGPITVVPAQYRGAASFFKDKSDKDIEELIKNYGQRVTPIGLVKRALNDQAFNAGYNHVTSDEYRESAVEYSHEVVAEAVEKYAIDTRAALASILKDHEETGDEFSVYDLASEVLNNVGLDERTYNWGVEAAMADVCRKAVREAPDVRIGHTKAPKFITCLYRGAQGVESETFIRVPFHAASLDQLRDMVALRLKQKHSAIRAHEELDDLLQELEDQVTDADGTYGPNRLTLGELAMRLAEARRRNDDADPDYVTGKKQRRRAS